jgi:hypothetical protein
MPQNAGYYHAAYLVASALYLGYIVTLAARWRSIRARRASLDRTARSAT